MRWCLALLGLLCAASSSGQEVTDPGIQIQPALFGAVRARSIGPAVMGGRIAALDAVVSDPNTIYVGAASGGVWKSKNGGIRFEPVFDDHCQSIGAISIDQTHPDTIWVGTGEPWVRNSVSVGNGVYKSTNGGESWKCMGLEDTERIGRIVVDPLHPQTVYVAALGHLWNANEERGLFKTTDGGATWSKVLYVDKDTGCADVAIVPTMPNILFASMWEFRRQPDFFTSGGPGSGLYRSTDGGASWDRLSEGLPEGELGRIAISVSAARPGRVYALIESEDSGFYRSDDMGHTWQRLDDSQAIKGRPFYFGLVVADPVDPDRVYKPGFIISMSRDSGERFEGIGGWVHVDYHALWINPHNPKHMLAGNDGGLYVTYNRGSGWQHLANLPISQFYRVSVDDSDPYWVYGGLQDNGSWRAPSRSAGGIENADWENLGGGDGFACFRDPRDENIVFWEWQGGNLGRLHLDTNDNKDIQPQPAPGEPEYRWNWNTPVVLSANDSARLYVGSQFLLRTTDRGDSWTRLSPDLTTNDPKKQRQAESGGLTVDNTSAENHCTIFAIAESPLDADLIWVGTDDGNLQVTTNDGGEWANVAGNVAGLPAHTWVSSIEPSRHARQTAFVTFDGHRNGDKSSYVYRTDDLGGTWRSIVTDDVEGYAHVLRQDAVNPDLLFLGTEFGLWITLDGGLNWAHYEEDFPPVPIKDMALHARENALILGTHGRGIWILDDLRPLRQITRDALTQDVFLLESPPAIQIEGRGKQHSPGDNYFVAGNPSSNAQIIYFLKKRHMFGDMKLEIFDAEGDLLKTLPGGKRQGINIVRWSMRQRPPKVTSSGILDPYTSFAGAFGPMAEEGTYTFKLTKGEEEYTGSLAIAADPGSPHSAEDRHLQQRTVTRLYELLEHVSYLAQAMADARDAAKDRANVLGPNDGLTKRLESFAGELTELRHTIVASEEEVQGISGERQVREKLVRLYAAIAMYRGRPGASQLDRIPFFEDAVGDSEREFQELLDRRLEAINDQLIKNELEPIPILTEEDYRNQEG